LHGLLLLLAALLCLNLRFCRSLLLLLLISRRLLLLWDSHCCCRCVRLVFELSNVFQEPY
jgi:hypothetical protein